MEELKHLLDEDPNTDSVNLEFYEVEDLCPMVPLLAKFPKLKELILFGNRLKSLPEDLSSLNKLEILDISSNLFGGLEEVLPGLESLPALKDLSITLQNEEQEQILLEALPHLGILNGTEIEVREEPQTEQSDSDNEQVNLKQEDLESVATVYDQIREIWRQTDKSKDKLLANDFDEHVRQVMGELSEVLKQKHASHIVHTHMLRAKFELYRICQQKLNDFFATKNKTAGKLLKETNSLMDSFFKDLVSLVFAVHPKYEDKLKSMKEDMDKAMKETNDLLEAAEQIEKESHSHKDQKEKFKAKYQQEIEELKQEVETLQEENKKYLELIIKQSKNNADSALGGKVQEDRIRPAQKPPAALNTSPFGVSQAISSRTLTLRQLKEVIEEIYTSKAKFDQKCADGKMPRETMEKHMYTFLNQKYGLKGLIIEWASAIIAGIKKYSAEDNDVAVFGKILRNECDEEFRFVQVQVKETAAELLKMHLRGKFSLKSNADITEMTKQKMQSFLEEDEWVDIVKYMYNESDSELIISSIQEAIHQKKYSETSPQKAKTTREEEQLRKEKQRASQGRIAYTDFLKIILDFQLKGHEKFLCKFIQLFRKVDSDNNGIINEYEFRELVSYINLGFDQEEEVFRLLQIVDPYKNEQITFSECVAVFSSETIPQDEQISILQKLSQD